MRITLSPTATLFHADCREALRELPSDSLDSCCTDPPYALTQVSRNGSPRNNDPDTPFGRTKLGERGFMGKTWDTGETAFSTEFWQQVYRVLKPGAFIAAFGASRGYHRMACAIEDAGFEIRDSLMWIYGTGFPKSHDVSKGIDARKDWKSLALLGEAIKTARTKLGLSQTEAARRVGLIAENESLGGGGFMWFETGRMPTRDEWPRIKAALSLSDEFDESFEAAERETIGQHRDTSPGTNLRNGLGGQQDEQVGTITRPLSALASEWEGWGTALKPAFEPIVLARKPLSESTVAANVLRWRTGALNIDGCRVPSEVATGWGGKGAGGNTWNESNNGLGKDGEARPVEGRWPANVVTDGSDEVVGMFPNTSASKVQVRNQVARPVQGSKGAEKARTGIMGHDDAGGSAARFFYSAKASKADRNGSKHPTVKPIALMQWLARLITPPGGTILDPFAGSGTTGAAAALEGFRVVLCEREAEYVEDIRARFGPAKPRLVIPFATLRQELALLPAVEALRARLRA